MQPVSQNFKKLMPDSLRQIIALFFLLFVLTDLTVVDALFPECCGGDMFGFSQILKAEIPSLADTGATPFISKSVISPFEQHHSDNSEPEDGCCFCCCTHVLPSNIFLIALPDSKPPTFKLPSLLQPTTFPHGIFHPPRLV